LYYFNLNKELLTLLHQHRPDLSIVFLRCALLGDFFMPFTNKKKYTKQPKSFPDQIELLRERGLKFDEFYKDLLVNLNKIFQRS